MGGNSKSKKNSTKTRRRRRSRAQGFEMAGLNVRERMQMKMEKKAKKKTEGKYSVEQLLEKAEECMDNFNFELAQMFCQRALDLEPNNLTILDMMGNIFAELGNSDKAKEVFQQAVVLSPDEGYAKYMYLGQIHCGQEAVQYFNKGIELMIKNYQKQKEMATQAAACAPDNAEVTPQNISTAFCSLAEIFLTDLCLEDEASNKCKEALGKAMEHDPDNPEALQLMASYLFSTEQKQEGKTFLMKSLERWLPSFQRAETDHVPQHINDLDPLQNLFPPYESRISAAKLLIEVQEYEAAIEVLEGLLDEDDEVVQPPNCNSTSLKHRTPSLLALHLLQCLGRDSTAPPPLPSTLLFKPKKMQKQNLHIYQLIREASWNDGAIFLIDTHFKVTSSAYMASTL